MGETGRVLQRCQYAGITCGGCLRNFEVGETMLSHGNALVHATPECELSHDALVAAAMAQDVEMVERAFYGVFHGGPRTVGRVRGVGRGPRDVGEGGRPRGGHRSPDVLR